MADRPLNVLFLCTGNSARSILAKAILNKMGADKFRAYSAGSRPKGQVHTEALQLLRSLGFDTSGFRSKSWASSPSLARPRSISSSLFATTRPAKRVRSGRGGR
jgi:hypothetical protein